MLGLFMVHRFPAKITVHFPRRLSYVQTAWDHLAELILYHHPWAFQWAVCHSLDVNLYIQVTQGHLVISIVYFIKKQNLSICNLGITMKPIPQRLSTAAAKHLWVTSVQSIKWVLSRENSTIPLSSTQIFYLKSTGFYSTYNFKTLFLRWLLLSFSLSSLHDYRTTRVLYVLNRAQT